MKPGLAGGYGQAPRKLSTTARYLVRPPVPNVTSCAAPVIPETEDHHDGRRSGGSNNYLDEVSCNSTWRKHLIEGRVSQVVWEDVLLALGGCGWCI